MTSFVAGAPLSAEPDLGALTIPGYLRDVTDRFGPREALVMREGNAAIRWTYTQLWDHSTEVARALLAAGVGKDTRVGVLMSNRPEFLAAAFGIALAGAVSVVLSTFSTARELEQMLRLSGIALLLYEPKVATKDFAGVLAELEPAINRPGPLGSARFPFLRRVVSLAPGSWSEFLRAGQSISPALPEATAALVKPADAAVVFFSSGTTGLPKGILHSQRAAAIQWWRWPRVLAIGGEIRCWTANGFFWSGQFSMAWGCAFSCGGTLVLQPTFDPEEALELMELERVTLPLAWPHQWAKLAEAKNWGSVDLHSLCYVDPRSPLARHPTVKTTNRWYETPAYGTSETFTIVAAFPGFHPGPGREHLQGPVLPGNTVKIVDLFTGDIVERGARGEIAVKGPTLMLGYLGVPRDETLDCEGFFRTGDGGYLDGGGQLFWEGRLSDIIKTGGANVSPREIDGLLSAHPGIELSRTVGIAHETLGEIVVTCLVLHAGTVLGETAIRQFLQEHLASYKVPRRVLFFQPGEIEMTGSDKVKSEALVRQAAARLAMESVG